MTWVQPLVAILAAIGGVGGIVQLVKAIQAWRDGVRQRETEADERLVIRLEKRVERLERMVDDRDAYIALLVTALGMAGVRIPMRAKGPEET